MTERLRPLFAIFAAVALTALGMFLAPAATAHDQLVSTNPKDGAKLDKQPGWIEMEFSGDIQNVGTEIQVKDPSGKDVYAGETDIKGKTLKGALPDDLKAGKYTVEWRVVSQDGHPISGNYSFSITDEGAAGGNVSGGSKDAQGSEGAETSGGAGLGAGAVDNPDDNSEDTRGDLASGDSNSGMSPALIVLLVVAAVAIIAVVVVLLLRKNRALESGMDEARNERRDARRDRDERD